MSPHTLRTQLGRMRIIPVEAYPILGVVAFSLSFMTYTLVHTSKANDVDWRLSGGGKPWDKINPIPEEPIKARFMAKADRMKLNGSWHE
ncbi:hypothetical protein [Phaffia rhodozyma]|uniref:Uncharacterized protein n=1 Tax=Phaffia rhodozyma TaxID=264483 RepID=A0A0F7SI17_PHARH|nr:hypothetical protein [Phaffia rhodozyma]